MNEDIIINLSFNEKNERDNQNFYFKYVWDKVFKFRTRIIVMTVVFLYLGFYPIENFNTNLLYYIIKYLGIFLGGSCLVITYRYFVSKKKFKVEVEKIIAEYKLKSEISHIRLNDKGIEFKNPINTICSIWEKTTYDLKDNHLVINPISNVNFIISKTEVMDNEFETILSFLQKYSKLKS